MQHEFARKSVEYRNLQRKFSELKKRNVTGLSPEMLSLGDNWSKLEASIPPPKPKEPVAVITKKVPPPIDDVDSCPPIVKPKPISLNKKDNGVMSTDCIMKANKLREQIATISRALGSAEDVLVRTKQTIAIKKTQVIPFTELTSLYFRKSKRIWTK